MIPDWLVYLFGNVVVGFLGLVVVLKLAQLAEKGGKN